MPTATSAAKTVVGLQLRLNKTKTTAKELSAQLAEAKKTLATARAAEKAAAQTAKAKKAIKAPKAKKAKKAVV